MEWNNKEIKTAEDLIEAIDDAMDGKMCGKSNSNLGELFGEAIGLLKSKVEVLECKLGDDESALEDVFSEIEDFMCNPNDYSDIMHIDELLRKLRKRHSKS